jgi:hypothetical protein
MPVSGPKIEDFETVLVVEGYSDLLFYAEILESVGRKVFIKDIGGRSGLRAKLETFITPSLLAEKKVIGFLFDADHNPDQTRSSMQSALSKLTGQSVVEGLWTGGPPRIGLMLVPSASTQGEIETLVWQSWANDSVNGGQKKCVEAYLACMEKHGLRPHSPAKGLISALLAVRSDEDPRLGPGARTNVFDLARPELDRLREFLTGF